MVAPPKHPHHRGRLTTYALGMSNRAYRVPAAGGKQSLQRRMTASAIRRLTAGVCVVHCVVHLRRSAMQYAWYTDRRAMAKALHPMVVVQFDSIE